MTAWHAFLNLLRAAARDPIWAVFSLVMSPLRASKHIVVTLLLYLVAWGALITLWHGVKLVLGIPKLGAVNTAAMLVINVFLLALLWRLFTAPLVRHFGNVAGADTHGSARFASRAESAKLTETPGLLIGRDPKSGKPLRYGGPSHLLTMAPTRTGKGVGTIIPNLLTLERSVVCIDPKGENARIAARARSRFGPVYVLDPFGVSGAVSAAFNPLSGLDSNSLDVAEEAAALADALVFDAPGEAGEAHWNEEAKALIGGLLLFIVSSEPEHRRSLATLRDLLTMAPPSFAALLRRMQQSPAAAGLVARAANRHLSKADREAAGVLSAAQRHTHFLDSPRMTAVLSRSDFAFADLKGQTATVFLVLPPDRLGSYSRWLRLLVAQGLQAMASSPAPASAIGTASRPPVLFLLDEFAALGHLAPVERAMGLMAGYGVQLWPILQDIHQLRATYGAKAGSFLSNAGVLQAFGVNDHDSAKLVSDLLGQQTVVFDTLSRALDSEKSGLSYGEQHVGRPLLTPDEVRSLPEHAELLFLAGQRPIVAQKLRYFDEPEFRGLFDSAQAVH
jgi:type IV secretion system protein VirD4